MWNIVLTLIGYEWTFASNNGYHLTGELKELNRGWNKKTKTKIKTILTKWIDNIQTLIR